MPTYRFPQVVPVATGIPHAVGLGMAASIDALERARDDDPVFVESLTYRQGPHTTGHGPRATTILLSLIRPWT